MVPLVLGLATQCEVTTSIRSIGCIDPSLLIVIFKAPFGTIALKHIFLCSIYEQNIYESDQFDKINLAQLGCFFQQV